MNDARGKSRGGRSARAPHRRLPVGAEVTDEGVHFRVWAPRPKAMRVVFEARESDETPPPLELEADGDGYWSGLAPDARAGDLYRLRLDDDETGYPDPASRFQPDGPHGPSEIVDPVAFEWTDGKWKGVSRNGQVLYEMHVGTFTQEGTWAAAIGQLEKLRDTGISLLQIMPLADFPGRFGWGYDGVNLFAPTRLYGRPDDVRGFVDAAHARGLGVILDVVYNHLGPDGNHVERFASDFFSPRYQTDWGRPPNFDLASVREFVLANVRHWIVEYHFDGFRIDAAQDIHDDQPVHVLADLAREARAAAGKRAVFIVAEDEPQHAKLVRSPDKGGFGLDALYNEDFHHTAMVLLSGHHEAYYSDYRGAAQEFVSAIKWGPLYQGQWYAWQDARRGSAALDLPPTAWANFVQNHDQVANSSRGQRCQKFSAAGQLRAMTALLLLAPQTPMLFQGQEFAASSPFFYFADHRPELARLVWEGRRKFMRQFPSMSLPEVQARIPDPGDPSTFTRSKIDWSERERHVEAHALHRDLLRMRREDPAFHSPRYRGVDGAVLTSLSFVLRFFVEGGLDRLLIVNFDADLDWSPSPEPLLGPPAGHRWGCTWSSEDFAYGGTGSPPVEIEGMWRIPGHAAVVMTPVPFETDDPGGETEETDEDAATEPEHDEEQG